MMISRSGGQKSNTASLASDHAAHGAVSLWRHLLSWACPLSSGCKGSSLPPSDLLLWPHVPVTHLCPPSLTSKDPLITPGPDRESGRTPLPADRSLVSSHGCRCPHETAGVDVDCALQIEGAPVGGAVDKTQAPSKSYQGCFCSGPSKPARDGRLSPGATSKKCLVMAPKPPQSFAQAVGIWGLTCGFVG